MLRTCVYVLTMVPRAKMPSKLLLLVGDATLKRPSPTVCDQALDLSFRRSANRILLAELSARPKRRSARGP